jgi:hypothetical protein
MHILKLSVCVAQGLSVYVFNGDQVHDVRFGLKLAVCSRAEIQK